eukprot:COSAG06_NODE_36_length_30622_cov_18.404869_25_plen_550_part_00
MSASDDADGGSSENGEDSGELLEDSWELLEGVPGVLIRILFHTLPGSHHISDKHRYPGATEGEPRAPFDITCFLFAYQEYRSVVPWLLQASLTRRAWRGAALSDPMWATLVERFQVLYLIWQELPPEAGWSGRIGANPLNGLETVRALHAQPTNELTWYQLYSQEMISERTEPQKLVSIGRDMLFGVEEFSPLVPEVRLGSYAALKKGSRSDYLICCRVTRGDQDLFVAVDEFDTAVNDKNSNDAVSQWSGPDQSEFGPAVDRKRGTFFGKDCDLNSVCGMHSSHSRAPIRLHVSLVRKCDGKRLTLLNNAEFDGIDSYGDGRLQCFEENLEGKYQFAGLGHCEIYHDRDDNPTESGPDSGNTNNSVTKTREQYTLTFTAVLSPDLLSQSFFKELGDPEIDIGLLADINYNLTHIEVFLKTNNFCRNVDRFLFVLEDPSYADRWIGEESELSLHRKAAANARQQQEADDVERRRQQAIAVAEQRSLQAEAELLSMLAKEDSDSSKHKGKSKQKQKQKQKQNTPVSTQMTAAESTRQADQQQKKREKRAR